MKVMVIVDCQKDFIDGSLGTPEAQAMMPRLIEKIKNEPSSTLFFFTRDTHQSDYLETREGKNLPIPHCIYNTDGWAIDSRLTEMFPSPVAFNKITFGSPDLINFLDDIIVDGLYDNPVEEVEFVGLCTDICVIANAILAKTYLPDRIDVSVDATCCAGVTPEKHAAALEVMKSCQITVKE